MGTLEPKQGQKSLRNRTGMPRWKCCWKSFLGSDSWRLSTDEGFSLSTSIERMEHMSSMRFHKGCSTLSFDNFFMSVAQYTTKPVSMNTTVTI